MTSYRGRPKLYPVEEIRDRVYSHAGGKERLADIFLPQVSSEKIPVIIWVHGGGWRFGNRGLAPDLAQFFAARGFAMVSFDYRRSGEAKFPAPVEDTKTVVRWVRSLAGKYNLDSENIGLWGSSAGGHLAACAALTTEDAFAGEEHAGYSSAVQAVVDGYGPTDLSLIDADRPPAGSPPPAVIESVSVPELLPASHPESFESRLLGRPVDTAPELVARANPIRYVRPGAPPFLILHGIHDTMVPFRQSLLLYQALEAAGNDATLLGIERFGHGFFMNAKLDYLDPGVISMYSSRSATPFDPRNVGFDVVESFFRRHLAADPGAEQL